MTSTETGLVGVTIGSRCREPLWTRGSSAAGCRWSMLRWIHDGHRDTRGPTRGTGRGVACCTGPTTLRGRSRGRPAAPRRRVGGDSWARRSSCATGSLDSGRGWPTVISQPGRPAWSPARPSVSPPTPRPTSIVTSPRSPTRSGRRRRSGWSPRRSAGSCPTRSSGWPPSPGTSATSPSTTSWPPSPGPCGSRRSSTSPTPSTSRPRSPGAPTSAPPGDHRSLSTYAAPRPSATWRNRCPATRSQATPGRAARPPLRGSVVR
jgi:hypothetical protein